MLVTMKEILDAARKGNYCVPAPNYGDALELKAAIDAAEESKSPLILDIGFFGGSLDEFIQLCKASREAAERASVPVAINLDHGGSFEHIVQAIYYGCTSVMIDRSAEPYESNVAQTKEIVRIAHACGVSVESEIGHVANNVEEAAPAEEGEGSGGEDKEVVRTKVETEEEKRKFYTNPEEAVKFVEETGVDCLAVAIGTVHGFYPEGFKPSLDFELLQELAAKVPVPLVVHGGSGTGEELLSKAAKLGVNKLNVGHDLGKAKAEALNAAFAAGDPDPIGKAYEGFKNELKDYMRFLGSKGQAA